MIKKPPDLTAIVKGSRGLFTLNMQKKSATPMTSKLAQYVLKHTY